MVIHPSNTVQLSALISPLSFGFCILQSVMYYTLAKQISWYSLFTVNQNVNRARHSVSFGEVILSVKTKKSVKEEFCLKSTFRIWRHTLLRIQRIWWRNGSKTHHQVFKNNPLSVQNEDRMRSYHVALLGAVHHLSTSVCWSDIVRGSRIMQESQTSLFSPQPITNQTPASYLEIREVVLLSCGVPEIILQSAI